MLQRPENLLRLYNVNITITDEDSDKIRKSENFSIQQI